MFLLDFVSLGDAALAIASVQLLSRLCRRRQDFLEAVRDMHLLDCGEPQLSTARCSAGSCRAASIICCSTVLGDTALVLELPSELFGL